MAALDKHRGKGQQKITVERVNVAPGGQAIVGHVQAAHVVVALAAPQALSLEAPRAEVVPLPTVLTSGKVTR